MKYEQAPFYVETRGFLRVLINYVKLFEKYFFVVIKKSFYKNFFHFFVSKTIYEICDF